MKQSGIWTRYIDPYNLIESLRISFLNQKTNDVEDESLSRAKIPQFDRSVKPPQQPYVNYANIQRDFSPVAGNTLVSSIIKLKQNVMEENKLRQFYYNPIMAIKLM